MQTTRFSGPLNPNTMKRDESSYIDLIKVVGSAIRDYAEVPIGPLFASVMHLMNYNQFNNVLMVLKATKMVRETKKFQLQWIGPREEKQA